jgi:hypothetical protein
VEHFQDVTVLIGRALAFDQWRKLVETMVDIADITRQPPAMSEELFGLPLCRTNACNQLGHNDLALSIGHGPIGLSDRHHHSYGGFAWVLNQIERIACELSLPAPAAK